MNRSESVRAANVRVAQAAERKRLGSRVPMFCECGDPECWEIVTVRLDEFRGRIARFEPLLAPGHSKGQLAD